MGSFRINMGWGDTWYAGIEEGIVYCRWCGGGKLGSFRIIGRGEAGGMATVGKLGSFRIFDRGPGVNWVRFAYFGCGACWDWGIGLYIVDCRMYIGCWELGSFRIFWSGTGPPWLRLGSFRGIEARGGWRRSVNWVRFAYLVRSW